MSEKRFRANFDVSIYDSEKEEYISVSDNGLEEIAKRMNELQDTINELQSKLKAVTMLKDDYEELIELFEKKYGKNIEDVIDDE